MTESAPAVEHSAPVRSKRIALVGLAIAYVGTASGFVLGQVAKASGVLPSRTTRTVIGLAFMWLITACILAYVRRVEHRPLSSIGVRGTRWTGYALTPLWWLGIILLDVLVVWLIRNVDIDTSTARSILELPVWTKILIVLTAAVTEEFLFRGYAVERLHELTGWMWIAAVIATLVFVAFHIPAYGVVAGLVRLPGSAVLTWIYIRRRSLAPVIVVHAMIDLPIVFVS